jgi:hypothetical protein
MLLLGSPLFQGAVSTDLVNSLPEIALLTGGIPMSRHQLPLTSFMLLILLFIFSIPTGAVTRSTSSLEFPSEGSYLFGIDDIWGWACNNGQQVTVTIDDGTPWVVAYGSSRPDTAAACGDIHNGFAYTFNWNIIGSGEHRVCAYLGSAEIGCATVKVLTLGRDFIPQGSTVIQPLTDIPEVGTTLSMQWDTPRQRPVVVGVSEEAPPFTPTGNASHPLQAQ